MTARRISQLLSIAIAVCTFSSVTAKTPQLTNMPDTSKSKYSLLEPTARVPLIVRVPGAAGNGQASQRLVELVDLVRTLGELVHLQLPDNLEGTSFKPLLDTPDRPWKTAVFTDDNDDRARSVRTERYRYIKWNKRSLVHAALYDLEKDPWETTNLANDSKYADQRKKMAALLKAGWKAVLPPEE